VKLKGVRNMSVPRWRSSFAHRALLLAVVGACLGAVLYTALVSAAPLLIAGTQGAWITAPGPVRLLSQTIVPGQTQPPLRFARVVRVHGPLGAARIRLRALGRVELRLNGQLIAEDRRCFKRACEIAVGPVLRAGPNAIEASVRNARGPEALSAVLEAPGLRLGTDETWRVARGDAELVSAVAVDDTRPYPPAGTVPTPLEQVSARVPLLLGLFALSALLFSLLRALLPTGVVKRLPELVLGAATLYWLYVFAAKMGRIPLNYGFDAPHHVAYVRFILEQGALPLASDGFSMYHPPLFYVLASGLLWIVAAAPGSPAEAWSLKLLPFLCGLGTVWVTYFLARRVFPERISFRCFAVGLAGVLPANLSLASYVSNEPLHAFVASLVCLSTVWLLTRSAPLDPGRGGRGPLMLWAALLGIAMLTKLTALLFCALALAFVILRAFVGDAASPGRILGVAAIGICGALAIGAWFYVRNWLHFADPFVWNLDGVMGWSYWIHPGFHTPGYFLRFGEALAQPYFAAFYSLWDGLYATIWGEGIPIIDPGYRGVMAVARSESAMATPAPIFRVRHGAWNYDFMTMSYLVALPVSLLGLVGLARCAWLGLHARDARARLALSFCAAVVFATVASAILVNLTHPFWATARSSYMLGALGPACVVTALGLEWADAWLAARSRALRVLYHGSLGLTAVVLGATFAG
jgi:hypothetical protein